MASVEVYGCCIMQQCHVRCLAQKKPFSWRDLTHLCLNYNNGDNAGNHMLLHMFVFKPLICGGQINLVQHSKYCIMVADALAPCITRTPWYWQHMLHQVVQKWPITSQHLWQHIPHYLLSFHGTVTFIPLCPTKDNQLWEKKGNNFNQFLHGPMSSTCK